MPILDMSLQDCSFQIMISTGLSLCSSYHLTCQGSGEINSSRFGLQLLRILAVDFEATSSDTNDFLEHESIMRTTMMKRATGSTL